MCHTHRFREGYPIELLKYLEVIVVLLFPGLFYVLSMTFNVIYSTYYKFISGLCVLSLYVINVFICLYLNYYEPCLSFPQVLRSFCLLLPDSAHQLLFRALSMVFGSEPPHVRLRVPYPLHLFHFKGLTSLVKLNRLQYAAYCTSDMIYRWLAPVSILLPLHLFGLLSLRVTDLV